MRKRSGKFYSTNEKKTLIKLGLTPAPMSGAGWIIKEDGENDIAMVQLKSTDSSSYRLDLLDIKKLEYHAAVSNKLPVFLIQFIQQDRIYAVVDVAALPDLHKALSVGEVPQREVVTVSDRNAATPRKVVRSSKKAREEFFKERGKKFGKK